MGIKVVATPVIHAMGREALPTMVTPVPSSYPFTYVCDACSKDIFGSSDFMSEALFICGHCGTQVMGPKSLSCESF